MPNCTVPIRLGDKVRTTPKLVSSNLHFPHAKLVTVGGGTQTVSATAASGVDIPIH